MWIIFSFIYAVTNAFYINYNNKRHYNGYVLGMLRGYGVSLSIAPLLATVSLDIPADYLLILIIQGILIGIYDSRIFFASAKYGGNVGFGFMATAVLITTFLWWMADFKALQTLLNTPQNLITIILILSSYSISYWQMMRVKMNKSAEQYLYPAVFALALMSIATRYIALKGGTARAGIIYYLTISCFISGIYNTVMYLKNRPQKTVIPTIKDSSWLIFFSIILIAAKTEAMRICLNPGYVVAILLTSPLIAGIFSRQLLKITPILLLNICLLILLIWFVEAKLS